MIKLEMEYLLNSSQKILFNRLSTSSGLSEWFADEVKVDDNIYTFVWEDTEEKAQLIEIKDQNYVRFKWLDGEDDTYFEFRIISYELTNDVALIVTDFALEDEREEIIELWEAQINKLKYLLGA